MLSNRNHCIVRMLRFGTPYPHRILGPYFVEDDSQNPLTVNQKRYWEIIIAPSVRDLKRFYHAEICYCDDSGCSKMELVDAARWSYSPHSEGVTCPSATTLWWSLNFHWNRIPVPFTLSWPQMPTNGACWKNPFSDQMTHLELFPNYGRRYTHFLCPDNLCSSACPTI